MRERERVRKVKLTALVPGCANLNVKESVCVNKNGCCVCCACVWYRYSVRWSRATRNQRWTVDGVHNQRILSTAGPLLMKSDPCNTSTAENARVLRAAEVCNWIHLWLSFSSSDLKRFYNRVNDLQFLTRILKQNIFNDQSETKKMYCLVQWNWFSDVTGCTWVTCIKWRQRTDFTAPCCIKMYIVYQQQLTPYLLLWEKLRKCAFEHATRAP